MKARTIPILHYDDRGQGPLVILLHGYMASSRYWQKVSDKLVNSGKRVIAMDLLGFGNSPKPFLSKYDYDAQLMSINATLQSLEITESFTLIGHSMGSLIALRYASEYTDHINKLLLTNMPVLLNYTDAKDEIFGTSLLYRIGLTPGLHTFIWPAFRAATYMRLIPQKIAEGAVARRSYMFQSKGWSRIRSMQNVIFAAKIEADLLKVTTATNIISGLNDRKRYFDNLSTLAISKNVQLTNIVGGHHLPLTHPDQIVSAVSA